MVNKSSARVQRSSVEQLPAAPPRGRGVVICCASSRAIVRATLRPCNVIIIPHHVQKPLRVISLSLLLSLSSEAATMISIALQYLEDVQRFRTIIVTRKEALWHSQTYVPQLSLSLSLALPLPINNATVARARDAQRTIAIVARPLFFFARTCNSGFPDKSLTIIGNQTANLVQTVIKGQRDIFSERRRASSLPRSNLSAVYSYRGGSRGKSTPTTGGEGRWDLPRKRTRLAPA